MNDESKSRLLAKVVGRVQGVSFRYFVLEQAEILSLTGWVRNLWDGSVEVLAEGLHQDLEKLLIALRIGPPMAKVANVEVEWQSYRGEFSEFRVKSSA